MHEELKTVLQYYHTNSCVPNLLFFGPNGSGKKSLVEWFLNILFEGVKEKQDTYTMWVNCAFGKGIKFIRDNLKNFAKINVCGTNFKVIVLHNADKLTCDAQSALRRCIEEYSFNTRFFMITSNKYKLLKPILSRLSDIYVSHKDNLHTKAVERAFPPTGGERARGLRLRQILKALDAATPLADLAEQLAEEAYSAIDVANYVETSAEIATTTKYAWLMHYTKIKGDFRSEPLLLFVLLHSLAHPGDFRPEAGVLSPI
jgi:DNA polymerase III delta prime subunit